MTAISLHVAVHLIVSPGASFKWLLSCCRACRAAAVTSHFAQSASVQTSGLDRVRPLAVDAFADGLAASSTAPPGRRCQERQRGAKAEGKIEGCGTLVRTKRSEEHTSELQSLMRISYAVFCLKKNKYPHTQPKPLISNHSYTYKHTNNHSTQCN